MGKYLILSIIIFLAGCNENKESHNNTGTPQKIELILENTTPTVDIARCYLISNDMKRDSAEALEILKVKRQIPLAMQKKDSLMFESILSKDFTITSDSTEFFNRTEFILNRIHGTWTIDTVKYQNLTLHFINSELALLTYKNVLRGTDDYGNPNLEYYVWADLFTKEGGKWKFLTLHTIDARSELLK